MILYHLSHTDLDGYGCQLITDEYFTQKYYFNANYGLEVSQSLSKILKAIETQKDEDIFFMISDLNLTFKEAKDLDKKVNQLNSDGYKIKLQLLDHHITGQKSAAKFEWYFLDVDRCATKIVYDYIKENFDGFSDEVDSWLSPLVDRINAVDIWLDDQKINFEFGKVCLSMVSRANEINNLLFADENRKYRLWLLRKTKDYMNSDNANILLDEDIHKLKKEYLNHQDRDDTLDNLSAHYLVHLLENKKDDLTVMYKNHKGLLTYTIGSISIPANEFLKANPDFDFFIDIGRRGSASLRADGKVDVSYLAGKLCEGGGGHKNAAGTKLNDFTETINYEDIKTYIQYKLDRI